MERRFLTTPEVADYLRLTPQALLCMRHRRAAPPAVRVGRRLLWPADALEEWISSTLQGDPGPNGASSDHPLPLPHRPGKRPAQNPANPDTPGDPRR